MAAKFVVHIYGDAAVLQGKPDPLIHDDGVFPTGPDNVTIKYPGKGAKTEAAAAPPANENQEERPEPAAEPAAAELPTEAEPAETTPEPETASD